MIELRNNLGMYTLKAWFSSVTMEEYLKARRIYIKAIQKLTMFLSWYTKSTF